MRFASTQAMQEVLSEFRDFYNFSRPHQALKGQTPAQVWQAQINERKPRQNTYQQKRGIRTRDSPS
jgi:transposase InsO family protein